MEEKAEEILKHYNQQHIIKHMKNLNNEKKENLIEQIENIDFEELDELYIKTQKQREIRKCTITPINVIDKNKLEDEEAKLYLEKGKSVIKNNKFAVITMAGGQGTRLRA